MNEHDIPDECINDPHFVQVLTATLTAENAANEKLLRDYREGIGQLKATVSREVESRKNIKQQIRDIRERKDLMEPLLEHLSQTECKRTTELTLLKNQLDEDSLRKQAVRNKYNEILNMYKETWEKYKAEYEEFEFAVARRKCKIELEKLKVQHMIKQYKKLEYHKMLKQKQKIDEKRIQSRIISLAKMMLDGWEKQKYLDTLNDKIKNCQNELETVVQKCKKMQEYSETEAETKNSARHKMPFPRLNISLVESLYVARKSHCCLKENSATFKPRIDSDTISVNTIMFEEMCNNEESNASNTICENHEDDEEEENESSQSMQQTAGPATIPNDMNNLEPESNVETLENICSQLSINEETCNKMHRTNETEEIRSQQATESHPKSQPSQEQFCDEGANSLKHKLATSEELNVNEDEPQQKQSRMVELPKQTSSSSPLTTKNNIRDETCSTTINSSGKENLGIGSTTESLPRIKKIETITRPITVQMKPPMAEVPPTPSSLFSPRHYAPSYASSENLSHYCDNNYNDPLQDVCGLDNYTDNWQNLSPPQAGSEISLSSTHAPIKNSAPNDNASFFPNQTEKPASNFFNFLTATQSTNPKSFI